MIQRVQHTVSEIAKNSRRHPVVATLGAILTAGAIFTAVKSIEQIAEYRHAQTAADYYASGHDGPMVVDGYSYRKPLDETDRQGNVGKLNDDAGEHKGNAITFGEDTLLFSAVAGLAGRLLIEGEYSGVDESSMLAKRYPTASPLPPEPARLDAAERQTLYGEDSVKATVESMSPAAVTKVFNGMVEDFYSTGQ